MSFCLSTAANTCRGAARPFSIAGLAPCHCTLFYLCFTFASSAVDFSLALMADRILIRDLRLRCLIGIHPEERETAQELRIHLTLFTDIKKAAASDFIGDAVDYQKVTEHILDFTETSSRLLLETLIEDMARMILVNFSAVEALQLRVEKPAALPLARFAGIEIERSRADFGI